MDQLVPGLGIRVGELFRVVQPAFGDLAVDRVEAHRQVSGEHRGVCLAGALRHRHRVGPTAILWLPLVRAGRALGQLPFIAIQDLQEAVVPLGGGVSPDDLQPTANCVIALSGAERALPADAHLLQWGCLGVGSDQAGVSRAMRLAEGVATHNERGSLLVVHRHPAEGLADIDRSRQRIRITVRAFGIDVDQSHLYCRQRVLQVTVSGVALVAQPGVFGTPVDVLFGLPTILAPKCEAKGLEPHGVHGVVARKDDQIGPGQLVSILFLDRPQ
ncbi:Uncharacterised protein [Mycobacteroides abscessus subsp. abscessus]|nr:Uncharacterised protein [Mycobacteroides abscessus subsp. abscessus]